MRVLLKIKMDTEATTRAIENGSIGQVIGETMERLQPEAAYFGPEGGVRTAFLVFDLKDPSDIPPISEPLFRTLKAKLEWFPVMDRDDLQKGLGQLG